VGRWQLPAAIHRLLLRSALVARQFDIDNSSGQLEAGRGDPPRIRRPGAQPGLHLNAHKPVLQWRAAQWLPVYLIVYLSPYGPLKNPVIPLWWDIAVTAVFSLVIYYWALAVALPTEQIQAMIDEVVVPEEETVADPRTH
jgi:transposase